MAAWRTEGLKELILVFSGELDVHRCTKICEVHVNQCVHCNKRGLDIGTDINQANA